MADKGTNGQSEHDEGLAHVSGMYKDYFLDYASYVILERAVPLLQDGLKPVQRRILHSMKEMDDGRFHKVANIIGQTMQYHPHGDAAIGDALVNLGQKELMIDCQGNWGDNRTGDRAAAPRYIEARLSKFALAVGFNAKTTDWQLTYDGRKKEPIALPMKFPMVLAQGVEGIAVGLSTRVLPHNFVELIKASIALLQGKNIQLIPDFPTGGMIDPSNYNKGKRGGKVRCRAHIEQVDKNTLKLADIPFGTTTSSLIDSIIKANDKGKIKIKKVTDNTAQHIEILIDLAPGISPDVTIDALYAFTDCEVSISPNACVIIDDKPHFMTVDDILIRSTFHTKDLLQLELEIKLAELKEKLLFASLEQIFIENRIYRDIEECETWEAVLETIDKGLDPYKAQFYREITQDDIVRLTEIRIKRISRFDSFKADELIRKIQEDIKQVEHHLAHLTEFSIAYFQNLLTTYGKGRERKTEIKTFDTIQVRRVAVANEKLYVNRKDGFIGYSLKKDEYIRDCSDIDNIIVFRADGKYLVTPIQEKAFVGKNIIHVDVWKKGNERMVYHAIYRDPASSKNFIKRFAVTAITRDREYDITKGSKGSQLLYFTANANSESEVVTVNLSQSARAKNKVFDFNFADLAIKGRSSQGNVLTKYSVKKVTQKSIGAATLGGRNIWIDETVGRLNADKRGKHLGEFDTEDNILVIYKDGNYELTNFELSNRYEMDRILLVEKFDPEAVVSAVHYDGKQKEYFAKRFKIETTTVDKKFSFISDASSSKLVVASTHPTAKIAFKVANGRAKEDLELTISEFIDVKGWKALGNRLDRRKVSAVKEIEQKREMSETLKPGDSVEWSGDDLKSDNQASLF